MKKLFLTAASLLASLALPATAKAAVVNGGFENGFANWQTIGDYRVETANGMTQVEGNSQAFLSTAFDEILDAAGVIRGGNAAPATFISGVTENSLEEFLGVSQFFGANFLADAIEGSAIKQTFTATAGQTLSFAWNFLTNESIGDNAEPDFNDFAFATLTSNSDNLYFRLADTTAQSFTTSSNPNFFEETGYQTFSYTIPTDGEYTLGLGVVDVGEPTVISGLLVDRVQTLSATRSVPEKSSAVGVLIFGTVGAVSVFKRQKRQRNFVSKLTV